MYKREVFDEFTAILGQMAGAECTKVDTPHNLISVSVGSRLVSEDDRFKNIQKQNAPDYIFQVFCLWRIVSPIHVIGCYVGPQDHNGFIRKTLSKLVGKKIQEVEVIRPALDLKIKFSENYTLEVICGGMGDEERNYRLITTLPTFKDQIQAAGYDVLENGILEYIASTSQ